MNAKDIPLWAQATDQRQEALDHDSAPRFYSDAELADRDVFDWFEEEEHMEDTQQKERDNA